MTEMFEQHGWIVADSRRNTDFGVDLSVFRRSRERFVLPFALSVQVKTTKMTKSVKQGGATVRVKSSTLAYWLWSSTPTICILYDKSSRQIWWSVPTGPEPAAFRAESKTRSLRLVHSLASEDDWSFLEATAEDLWDHHVGAGVLLDLPLIIQVLLDVADATDLWTSAGGTSDAIYHAAAIHAYRAVAALNAISGRIGSDSFLDLANPAPGQVSEVHKHGIVRRGDTDLGLLFSIVEEPRSEYLVEIFSACGHELASAVGRLREMCLMSELGIPQDLVNFLMRVDDLHLSLIDPERSRNLVPEDFHQLSDYPMGKYPSVPNIDNRVRRMLGRPRLVS